MEFAAIRSERNFYCRLLGAGDEGEKRRTRRKDGILFLNIPLSLPFFSAGFFVGAMQGWWREI
jgi:hypothetical protein